MYEQIHELMSDTTLPSVTFTLVSDLSHTESKQVLRTLLPYHSIMNTVLTLFLTDTEHVLTTHIAT